jgi:hypothetical protein
MVEFLSFKHMIYLPDNELPIQMSQNIFNIPNIEQHGLNLTCGNDKLMYDQNVNIFNYAFESIRKCNIYLHA